MSTTIIRYWAFSLLASKDLARAMWMQRSTTSSFALMMQIYSHVDKRRLCKTTDANKCYLFIYMYAAATTAIERETLIWLSLWAWCCYIALLCSRRAHIFTFNGRTWSVILTLLRPSSWLLPIIQSLKSSGVTKPDLGMASCGLARFLPLVHPLLYLYRFEKNILITVDATISKYQKTYWKVWAKVEATKRKRIKSLKLRWHMFALLMLADESERLLRIWQSKASPSGALYTTGVSLRKSLTFLTTNRPPQPTLRSIELFGWCATRFDIASSRRLSYGLTLYDLMNRGGGQRKWTPDDDNVNAI